MCQTCPLTQPHTQYVCGGCEASSSKEGIHLVSNGERGEGREGVKMLNSSELNRKWCWQNYRKQMLHSMFESWRLPEFDSRAQCMLKSIAILKGVWYGCLCGFNVGCVCVWGVCVWYVFTLSVCVCWIYLCCTWNKLCVFEMLLCVCLFLRVNMSSWNVCVCVCLRCVWGVYVYLCVYIWGACVCMSCVWSLL